MSLFNGRYQSPKKSDGTINSGGKAYFYETGTSTLKSVYTDEALTTAHTNPVILDSAGSALIFLAAGSYDYKVDDSDDVAVVTLHGPVSSNDSGIISTNTTWTVDGVGGSSGTYATIAAALTDARLYVLSARLTIHVNAGTYTDDAIDFSHPQGAYIFLEGADEATTILTYSTVAAPVIGLTGGNVIGAIYNFTITQDFGLTGSFYGIFLDQGARILDLYDVTINIEGGGAYGIGLTNGSMIGSSGTITVSTTDSTMAMGLRLDRSSIFNGTTLNVTDFASYGIYCYSGSQVTLTDATLDNSSNGGGAAGVYASDASRVTITGDLIAKGKSTDDLVYGAWITYGAYISVGRSTMDEIEYCYYASVGCMILMLDAIPSHTNITTAEYNITVDQVVTASGSNTGAIIYTA